MSGRSPQPASAAFTYAEADQGWTPTQVLIIGTGLIGTSVGMALTNSAVAVALQDLSMTNAALARDLGAGQVASAGDPTPDLVVIAAPPEASASLVGEALHSYPQAIVTDVASVKGIVIDELRAKGADVSRFCGSHPMAGRERSGAIAGRPDLFHGRAWVLTPTAETSERAVAMVTWLARTAGGSVITLDAGEHDAAVAAVSHAPQVVASLLAARLQDVTESAVVLAGQGMRDTIRIAASDPQLWTQILIGNAGAVRDVLRDLGSDLERVVAALNAIEADFDAPHARGTLARALAAGNAGHARLPDKHGRPATAYTTVRVLVPDQPGQLGRLFADAGELGINIEEFRIDHGLGQSFGLAELDVAPVVAESFAGRLAARGWQLHT